MPNDLSNHYKAQLHRGNIDYDTDVFKIMLMAEGFVWDRDTHATLANVTASELDEGNGYSAGGQVLANVDLSSIEDDTNDRSEISWDDALWTPDGGNIGPSPGAIIIDDTTADDTVVGFLDFGADLIATPGGSGFRVVSPTIRLS